MFSEQDLFISSGKVSSAKRSNSNVVYPSAALISNQGSGSNALAMIEAGKNNLTQTPVEFILSDKKDAPGLQHAKKHGVPYLEFPLPGKTRLERNENRKEYSKQVAALLNEKGIKIAVLAGYMTILDEIYFDVFQGVTLNIHPGWIPDREDQVLFFPDGTPAYWNRGLMTDDAITRFDQSNYAGSTIHIATPLPDFGPVLERVYITKKKGENLQEVYDRLKVEERRALTRSLKNPERIFQIAGKV